eukprot:comp9224_c0_seq1/m.4364 comp9224_c0_seq1/g.4364  ORF comp9224_c0_seq1/g.4364 comp9224_c0_seq1/m.4364 type:complete len:218 (-) comp9224_c0_seq1:99-752(-)
MAVSSDIKIGVLALQGAFIEHINILVHRLGVQAATIRTVDELNDPTIDGLIIPGGESTTMALVAERWGLMEPLREFAKSGKKPVWGTCAGLIFLAQKAQHTKIGGQTLIGGLDIEVDRNHFGSQVDSFETHLSAPCLGDKPFHAVFIRAPVVTSAGDNVQVLSRVTHKKGTVEEKDIIVAVQQGSLLGTSFHPELTGDYRWHKYFVDMVRAQKKANN